MGFTLSNARRFYSSIGNPLDGKGLRSRIKNISKIRQSNLLEQVIGKHIREQHGYEPHEIAKNFRVLRKCSNKFDCLTFEMFFFYS